MDEFGAFVVPVAVIAIVVLGAEYQFLSSL